MAKNSLFFTDLTGIIDKRKFDEFIDSAKINCKNIDGQLPSLVTGNPSI
jgi:hypothetical protein